MRSWSRAVSGISLSTIPEKLKALAVPLTTLRLYETVWNPIGVKTPQSVADAGKAAHAYALTLCPPGTKVTVVSHGWDKYGGRFDGSLTLPDGTDFATLMLAAGQAVVMP